jgi:hypothetical protein
MTLRAITGSSTSQQYRVLFEHLIGGREQGWQQVMTSALAVVEGVNGRQTGPAPPSIKYSSRSKAVLAKNS